MEAKIDLLYELYTNKLKATDTGFIRYLHDKINWDSRLIVITGSRGVGKTTMVMQHIKLTHSEDSSLYISADNTYFSANTLYDTATAFYRNNGKTIYIDEVHKYSGWSSEVKMMYDYLPDLKIVVTGSSILELKKGTDADLSRRAIMYTLEGMSFREYLNFSLDIKIKPASFDEILMHKIELPVEIKHPLPLFNEYLKIGYYPFYKQDDYYLRIDNVVNQTLEVDIPTFAKMTVSTIRKLKRLMYIISRSVPFKPNFTEIGRALETDRTKVSDYIVYMEKAGLLRQLKIADDGMVLLEKVDKIYLSNPTLAYALSDGSPDIGNIRETMFFSSMLVNNVVSASPVSDFMVRGCTFEVGGRSKKKRQILNVDNAYVVKDDIENGYLNVLPLWTFGMNY